MHYAEIYKQKLPCKFDVASTYNVAPLDHGQYPDITWYCLYLTIYWYRHLSSMLVAGRYVSNRQCVIDGNQSGHVVNMMTTLFAKLQLFLMSKPTEGKFAFIFIFLGLYAIVK